MKSTRETKTEAKNDPLFASPEKVIAFFNTVLAQIENQQLEAKEQNKQFVLMLGETHHSNHSLFIETLIFIACNILGIKNAILEGDHQFISKQEKMTQSSVNTSYLIHLSKTLNIKYAGTDEKSAFDGDVEKLDIFKIVNLALIPTESKPREAAMYRSIIKTKNDLIFVVGNAHTANIGKLLENNSNVHLLCIKTCNNSLLFSPTTNSKLKSLTIQAPHFEICEKTDKTEVIKTAIDIMVKNFFAGESFFASCKEEAMSHTTRHYPRDLC